MSRQGRERRRRFGGRAQTASRRCAKLRYTTAAAAEAAAKLRAEADPRYPSTLRAYACPFCLGFHLTSQPPRSRKPST